MQLAQASHAHTRCLQFCCQHHITPCISAVGAVTPHTLILRLCIHLASMMLSSDIASLDSAAAAAAIAACPAGCGEYSADAAEEEHRLGWGCLHC